MKFVYKKATNIYFPDPQFWEFETPLRNIFGMNEIGQFFY